MRHNLVPTAAVAISLALLAGCSSQPSTADLMRGQAEEAKAVAKVRDQLADQWEEGKSLVAAGEKQIVSGEDLVDDGEANVRKGQALIEKGNKQIKKGKARITSGNKQVAQGRKMVDESLSTYRQSFPEQSVTLEKK
ncbi:hypothetical protein F8A90_17420 [Cobetia sp. cqz5-12]|uniref:hypothetical protein n=1 Tax=Cobetia sp. cqz5-12 TaxID=2609415 RepID=UPI0019035C22|nr:hypothetical protein [Cobetia sp. cqz5-12]QQK65689.1 hypothetical protein F8A90_17420 [Cobetia sp. cqz5-12]